MSHSQTPKGPLFKWFGSKWQASRYYPRPHSNKIVEPFAGGAGYSLRNNTDTVILAESNPHIHALWEWLINDADEQSIASIPLDLAPGTDIRALSLSDGQKLLLKNWQRTNNVGNCWTTSPWGNLPGQWTENTRRRVSKEAQYVKGWEVRRDGFELLESPLRGDSEITWFIDPPYLYNYRYGVKSEFDYSRLASAVSQLKGHVIVCEAICPKTKRVPDYLDFVFFKNTVTSRRAYGNNTHSKELMYHRMPE